MKYNQGIVPVVLIIVILILAGGSVITYSTIKHLSSQREAGQKELNNQINTGKAEGLSIFSDKCQGASFVWFGKDFECSNNIECYTWAEDHEKELEELGIDEGEILCCQNNKRCGYYPERSGLDVGYIIQNTFRDIQNSLNKEFEYFGDTGCYYQDNFYNHECKNNRCFCAGDFSEDLGTSKHLIYYDKWEKGGDVISSGYADMKKVKGTSLEIKGISRWGYEDNQNIDSESKILEEGYQKTNINGYAAYEKINLEEPEDLGGLPFVCLDESDGKYYNIEKNIVLFVGKYRFEVCVTIATGSIRRLRVEPNNYAEVIYCANDNSNLHRDVLTILMNYIFNN